MDEVPEGGDEIEQKGRIEKDNIHLKRSLPVQGRAGVRLRPEIPASPTRFFLFKRKRYEICRPLSTSPFLFRPSTLDALAGVRIVWGPVSEWIHLQLARARMNHHSGQLETAVPPVLGKEKPWVDPSFLDPSTCFILLLPSRANRFPRIYETVHCATRRRTS
jgi:hypothetical protein